MEIKLIPAIIGLSSIAMLSLIILIIQEMRYRRKLKVDPNTEMPKIAYAPFVFITGVASVLIVTLCINFAIAKTHGLVTTDITLQDMSTGIEHSSKEDELPDNIENAIIIYYKFGCKDCEAIYDDLSSMVENKPNIYWVSIDSVQGKYLIDKYPVDNVPTGIYIRSDKWNGKLDFTQYALATNDSDNNKILNIMGINRLLYLQQEKR